MHLLKIPTIFHRLEIKIVAKKKDKKKKKTVKWSPTIAKGSKADAEKTRKTGQRGKKDQKKKKKQKKKKLSVDDMELKILDMIKSEPKIRDQKSDESAFEGLLESGNNNLTYGLSN